MKQHKIATALIGTLLLAGTSLVAQAGSAEPAVSIQRLTMETAERMARAAVDSCRQQGLQVSVAVVDRNGVPQAQLRDTLAPPVSLDISRGKAYTAANFYASTADLGRLADGPIGRQPGVIMSAGGLPIEAAGQLLGGIGVSGAPSGQLDQSCAQAGIDAVLEELELSL